VNPNWSGEIIGPLGAVAADGFVDITVDDHDTLGSNDFMGLVRVPLSKLESRQAIRRWYPLMDKDDMDDDNLGKRARGEVEVQLRWTHNPMRVEAIGWKPAVNIKVMLRLGVGWWVGWWVGWLVDFSTSTSTGTSTAADTSIPSTSGDGRRSRGPVASRWDDPRAEPHVRQVPTLVLHSIFL